jgi:alpha-glucosidase
VKKDIWVDCGLERIPVYMKAGAVLPHWPLQQYVGEIPNPEPELHVWWKNGHEQSFWYEDAGDGESWRNGVYRESTIEVIGTAETLEINRSRVGTWTPGYAKISIVLRGLPAGMKTPRVEVDGTVVTIELDPFDRPTILVSPDFTRVKVWV